MLLKVRPLPILLLCLLMIMTCGKKHSSTLGKKCKPMDMILINWLKDHLMGNSKFQRCKTNISVINKWQFSNLVRNILLFSKKFLFECKTRIALISLVNRASFLLFVFHYSFLFTMWFCLKRWLFRHLLVENGVYFRNHTLYSEYVQSV